MKILKSRGLLLSFIIVLTNLAACGQNDHKTRIKMETIQTATTASPKMKVEIWSDIMCPFCYIGKRQYEAALKKFADSNYIEVVWKSFQLDPSIPEEVEKGLTSAQYLASRKGISAEQVKQMHVQVMQMAQNAGLVYNLDNALVYNSFKAHRIIQFAKAKGLGEVAEETFFRAHFTFNKDLGEVQTLTALGLEIGLTEAEVNDALTNDEYASKVKQDIQEAQQIGVTGVPFFVFDRKYAVSGAQPVASFLQTLEKSFAEWRKDNPATKLETTAGNVCTPEGTCN